MMFSIGSSLGERKKPKVLRFILVLSVFFAFSGSSVISQVSVSEDGSSPDASAILEAKSNDKGFLPPRLTNEERDNIPSPADGLVIFNTSSGCLEFFNNPFWYNVCGSCAPIAPAAGNHVPGEFEVVWNWGTISGATGYKYNTSNNYFTAIDNGTSTSYLETDLSCNSIQTLYVWAYNSCGQSAAAVLTANTSACSFSCGNTLSIVHNQGEVGPESKTVHYGTVTTNLSGESKCWITQNLGADNQASSVNDASTSAAGWYWQFNRKQGYKRGSPLPPVPAWTISTIDEDSNWVIAEDPCRIELGPGWRIPTVTEWENVVSNWSNYTQFYSSVLKLHTSGRLETSNGEAVYTNIMGQFWFSTQGDNTNARNLYFDTNNSYFTHIAFPKAWGLSVRCIRD